MSQTSYRLNMIHQNFKFSKFLFFVIFLGLTSCQSDTVTIQTPSGQENIASDELLKIVGEAYIYGYPLVLMDLTKRVTTNVEKPHPVRPLAPVNQLGHFRKFPDHTLTAVVKPNVDTYYSIAWLDLAAEPQVLSMPATERYYLLQMLDAYFNVFASPGTRTTGTEAQTILIAGPNWQGETPEGFDLIQAPTEMVWMLGRIQVNNPEDGATVVRAIQDSMKLVPLSAYGKKDYTPPIGIVKPENKDIVPVKTIRELDVNTYFNRMTELMVQNPPAAADSAIVKKMAKIGLVAGQSFNLNPDDFVLKTKLNALPNFIHKKMEERRANPDTSLLTNGWMFVREGIGTYGTDYLRRAYIDFIALGACIPEDAVYPNCTLDANNKPLDAQNNYQIHFEANQIPPARAFWSLTAYNADEFLVENELNRFALGDRDDLKYNKDGSLDLYIQSESPSKENLSNWLPIPQRGAFSLTLRVYWPKEEVLNGDWEIPFVVPVE
ncbi:MAG: DUF1254 domain-containing protein [Chitinophagales bacterium]